ncbi:lactonase family protein [Tessaracoccus sp. OS52]|uniref:lactonase family protein n=1 Tax=Tessaracoccus sp. OS52 TaxID=2886691 RepID=UPI001D0FFB36|nr:beta-propeller fold lactonase family protein [Tessaracoccus sp. OS52]MCC2592621.1 lactonase family protein [Tessaracoccus sp. OS52]
MSRRTLLVGNNTDASGEGGLQVFGLDDADVVPGPVLELPSPTYLVLHPQRDLVCAISSGPRSLVHSLQVDRTAFPAQLELVSSAPVERAGACHLAVSPDGGHVLVASYDAGALTSFAIDERGGLSRLLDVIDFDGSGPHPDRQEAAHAHQVVFDGDVALVTDLGADRVHRVRLGADGTLVELEPIVLPAGMGPRHLVLREDRLVVVGELNGRLWVGDRQGETFTEAVSVRASVNDETYPAALRLRDDLLLVSLRGCDTVAEFLLTGDQPEWLREFPVGAWPRDFVVDGDSLWVAHEHGATVGRYDLRAEAPEAQDVLASVSPASLLLLPAR